MRHESGPEIRRMAENFENDVTRARAEQLALRSLARARAVPSRSRWIVAVAGSSMIVVATAGIGLAADGAVPGDPLYRVDRAFERVGDAVGLRGDRSVERLEEVIALVDRGDVERARVVAMEALDSLDSLGPVDPDDLAPTDPVVPPAAETTTTSTPLTLAAPDGEADDAPADEALTLRLAAERLLRSVRGTSAEVETAAAELALAAAPTAPTPIPAEPTPTATSTSTTSTTSTTTSTIPDGSTTTTTAATGGGSGGDDGGEDEGPGPIILPPIR